jgi:uncharacterized SAM-binding protein YcdF (DUF218 family)
MRHVIAVSRLFSITVSLFAGAGLLFCLLMFWPFARDFFCKTKERATDDALRVVFLNIAFFVTIVFLFEGQERYNYPVLIFFIFTLVWLAGRARSLSSAPTAAPSASSPP